MSILQESPYVEYSPRKLKNTKKLIFQKHAEMSEGKK